MLLYTNCVKVIFLSICIWRAISSILRIPIDEYNPIQYIFWKKKRKINDWNKNNDIVCLCIQYLFLPFIIAVCVIFHLKLIQSLLFPHIELWNTYAHCYKFLWIKKTTKNKVKAGESNHNVQVILLHRIFSLQSHYQLQGTEASEHEKRNVSNCLMQTPIVLSCNCT